LSIYHDGADSVITDTGTGNLLLCSSDLYIRNAANDETTARFTDGGAAKLYYANAEKLATVTGGVDITGNMEADNITIAGAQGSDGQVLTSTGSGVAWEDAGGGAYSSWLVKTANFTCASGDQLICNHASTAFTITLPTGAAGATVVIANAGAATVTIGRNSSNINSAAADGTLPQGNSVQLVYVDSTIGWFEV
jgi:hypothetical protein